MHALPLHSHVLCVIRRKIIFFFDPEVFFILNSHTFTNYLYPRSLHFSLELSKKYWKRFKMLKTSWSFILSTIIIEIYDIQLKFYRSSVREVLWILIHELYLKSLSVFFTKRESDSIHPYNEVIKFIFQKNEWEGGSFWGWRML